MKRDTKGPLHLLQQQRKQQHRQQHPAADLSQRCYTISYAKNQPFSIFSEKNTNLTLLYSAHRK